MKRSASSLHSSQRSQYGLRTFWVKPSPSMDTIRTEHEATNSYSNSPIEGSSTTALPIPATGFDEESVGFARPPVPGGESVTYLVGWQMTCLIIGLTMASFLLMIDSTILVTVCFLLHWGDPFSLCTRQYLVLQQPSIPPKMLDGTEAHTFWLRKYFHIIYQNC